MLSWSLAVQCPNFQCQELRDFSKAAREVCSLCRDKILGLCIIPKTINNSH